MNEWASHDRWFDKGAVKCRLVRGCDCWCDTGYELILIDYLMILSIYYCFLYYDDEYDNYDYVRDYEYNSSTWRGWWKQQNFVSINGRVSEIKFYNLYSLNRLSS